VLVSGTLYTIRPVLTAYTLVLNLHAYMQPLLWGS